MVAGKASDENSCRGPRQPAWSDLQRDVLTRFYPQRTNGSRVIEGTSQKGGAPIQACAGPVGLFSGIPMGRASYPDDRISFQPPLRCDRQVPGTSRPIPGMFRKRFYLPRLAALAGYRHCSFPK
jgi:hypothetical protein